MNILVLGSGVQNIPEGNVTTIDSSLRNNPTIVGDLNIFPWPIKNEQFDLVVCSHILEHLNDISSVMSELYRVTKPSGKIIITCPYAHSFAAYSDPTHVHFFLPESFTEYFCIGGDMSWMGKDNLFVKKKVTLRKNTSFDSFPISLLKFLMNGITEFEIVLEKPEVKKE